MTHGEAAVDLVVPAAALDPGSPTGGNVYDTLLAEGLRAHGRRVRLIGVPGGWPEPDAETVAALAGDLAAVPDGRPVIIDGLIGSAAPGVLAVEGRRLRIALLVHLPLGYGDSAARPAERQALAAAARIVATSGATRDWLAAAYGLRHVDVVRPGAAHAPPATRTTTGHRLLSVGALTPGKGHDLLIAALSRLTALNWSWEVVGDPTRDPGHAASIRAWAEDQPAGRVRISGVLTGAELAAAYDSADLLVHPSRAETYGMVLTEALARGIPVLAAETGGVPEAVGRVTRTGQRPGILVAPGDVGALAGALRRWLTDAALRRGLRAAALRRRDDLEDWSATAARFDAVVTRLDRRPAAVTTGSRS